MVLTWMPPMRSWVGLWGYLSMHCISIMWAEWWVNTGMPRLNKAYYHYTSYKVIRHS